VTVDREIDEQSPDEDDRLAQQNLQSPERAFSGQKRKNRADDNPEHDVLEMHKGRNRKVSAPNPSRLNRAAPLEDLEPEIGNFTDDEPEPLQKRTRRNTNHHEPNAKQMQFYPGHWRNLLEKVKKRYRLYLATENGFPNREDHLDHAIDILTEELTVYFKKGEKAEKGIIFPLLKLPYLPISKDISLDTNKKWPLWLVLAPYKNAY
jgi:hypothetical protein